MANEKRRANPPPAVVNSYPPAIKENPILPSIDSSRERIVESNRQTSSPSKPSIHQNKKMPEDQNQETGVDELPAPENSMFCREGRQRKSAVHGHTPPQIGNENTPVQPDGDSNEMGANEGEEGTISHSEPSMSEKDPTENIIHEEVDDDVHNSTRSSASPSSSR